MILTFIAIIGLIFGSFVNALVWRVHEQSSRKNKKKRDLSIINGRSMCTDCSHKLGSADLVPVISWIILRGKCRYCNKPISWQYPAVELGTALLFVLSYIYWPAQLQGLEVAIFGLWLVSIVGLTALLVYDLRWMLLPNRIIFPLYGVALAINVLRIIQSGNIRLILDIVLAVVVGGGLFYLLFQISRGAWIGGGDVKLGFLLGALLGTPAQAAIMIYLSSLIGALVVIPLLISKKASKKTRIPFGPFLIISAIIVHLVGSDFSSWYFDTFIDVN